MTKQKEKYTLEQRQYAERIMRAANRVPEEKRNEFECILNGMLLGLDLAAVQQSGAAIRPGA